MSTNHKRPFISKIIQFPSGEPIAPEGYTIINMVRIGNGGGEYKLPIPVCVKKDCLETEAIKEIIDALAGYYGWEKTNTPNYINMDLIANIQVLGISGYKFPVDVVYQTKTENDLLQIILYNLALRYQWERVKEPSFDYIMKNAIQNWDPDEIDEDDGE